MTQTYMIMMEQTEDGFYAEVPSVEGVYAQGDTQEEALVNIQDVLQMTLDDMKARGENFSKIKTFPHMIFSQVSVNV